MEDDLAAGHGAMDALIALDVALDDLGIGTHSGQVGASPGGEVVQDPHLRAPLEQRPREV